jgi:hypothetical protein
MFLEIQKLGYENPYRKALHVLKVLFIGSNQLLDYKGFLKVHNVGYN